METFYEGRMIYAGYDDPLGGLVHGAGYYIKAGRMSNGKVRVDILSNDLESGEVNHRLTMEEERYDKVFQRPQVEEDGK